MSSQVLSCGESWKVIDMIFLVPQQIGQADWSALQLYFIYTQVECVEQCLFEIYKLFEINMKPIHLLEINMKPIKMKYDTTFMESHHCGNI